MEKYTIQHTGKHMNHDEDDFQAAVCQLLDLKKVLYFAVPNGGSRNAREAARMKRQGVKAGVPDIIILRAGKALGMELKLPKRGDKPKTYLSKAQKEFHERMSAEQIDVVTVRTLDEVYDKLKAWPDAGLFAGEGNDQQR